MNAYDAARMVDVLAPHGYAPVPGPDDADLVILNTCHIREKAAEKVYSDLGRLRQLRERRVAADGAAADMIIAVGGCVAQAEGAELLRRAPSVDIAFGPQTYHRLPEMIGALDRAGPGVLDTEFPIAPKFDFLPAPTADGAATAFLTIQEGCDRFCSFCVVPYTRGSEFSRPVADILTEARGLVAGGVREITLLGQNVNAYHGAAPSGGALEWRLGRLIRELAEIDGLARIRYTTSHPRDMDEELITAHGEVPQLMPYLHLPVQSGSDNVLAAMNRGHLAADYLRIVDALRRVRPDLALSSDFIVGHPGESDDDFEDTMRLVREVGFAQAYSFKYSRRPGTPAAVLRGQAAEDLKTERLAVLQALLNDGQQKFNDQSIGRTVPVLFDRPGGRDNQVAGRSPYMQAVHAPCRDPGEVAARLGTIAQIHIVASHANSLAGRFASDKVELAGA